MKCVVEWVELKVILSACCYENVCALTPTTSPVTNSEAVHHSFSFSHICEMSRTPYHNSLITQRSLLACSLSTRTLRRPLGVRIVDQTSRMSFRTSKPQMSKISQLPYDQKFEEERYLKYKAHQYYPVQLGQTFASRYRVIAKLGYGTASTVWLSRDLKLSCILSRVDPELLRQVLTTASDKISW